MATSFRKKLFLLVFCLASITQGMYSTYFVSILTTLERIYQIQSKTAGAIISATEIGQILGSLFIAYYGGRGNKPKWMSVCMTVSAIAALISISPHFILLAFNNGTNLQASTDNLNAFKLPNTSSPYAYSDLNANLSKDSPTIDLFGNGSLCRNEKFTERIQVLNTNSTTLDDEIVQSRRITDNSHERLIPINLVIAIFSVCLLAIGFGSTAITTLGIPFIDDIISKEESPLYLGLTIGLKIFGPALGFLLGSFCIGLDSETVLFNNKLINVQPVVDQMTHSDIGAWWLGLIVISIPLLVLAIPMYFLSRNITSRDSEKDDFEDITYQAAEDHDIGGSHDFPANIMGLAGDLDVTSNRTCFSSDIDSSSREVLQICRNSSNQPSSGSNYKRNIAFEQSILSKENTLDDTKKNSTSSDDNVCGVIDDLSLTKSDINEWHAPNVCLVVNYLGIMDSTNVANDVDKNFNILCQKNKQSYARQQTATRSSNASSISHNEEDKRFRKRQQPKDKSTIADLSSSLSRLIKNRLLVLRMLSGILHILPIAGFYTFLPKYLIEQFRMTSSSASMISGLAGILFVGFGAFIGGTIIRLFNVNSRLMTRWIATSALFYCVGMIILMNLSCDQNQIVHFNSKEFMSTECSISCKCAQAVYNPVCANGTTYVSPCLVGCTSYATNNGKISYNDCGCKNLNTQKQKPNFIEGTANLDIATQGQCSTNCDNIIWYVILFSIFTLIHSSCEVGSVMFNLRCVKTGDRTLALGLITFTSSLLGTIPCSVIYGSIVDATCVHWDRHTLLIDKIGTSLDQGACRAYDNDSFRFYLHGLTALVMFLAFIVDCIISTQSRNVNFYESGHDDSKTDMRAGLKKSTETMQ